MVTRIAPETPHEAWGDHLQLLLQFVFTPSVTQVTALASGSDETPHTTTANIIGVAVALDRMDKKS